MSILRLLLVEDSDEDIRTYRDSIARYKDEKSRDIDLVECRTLEQALQKLDNSFDGAIIDLKLADQGGEGVQVISKIKESRFRIPTAVVTATPDDVDNSDFDFSFYKKGEIQYIDLLDDFYGIYDTGLTRIMGGRGQIEDGLYNVFHKNLLPQKEKWVTRGQIDTGKTERALLRHTLNHLLQLLDDDDEQYYPEEVYIHPPLAPALRTGGIVKHKTGGTYFVILTPACDLIIRAKGKCKTDRILLLEVEVKGAGYKPIKSGYYHYLPPTSFFIGGELNFRKLTTLGEEDFHKEYDSPVVQISPPFVKDIVARFSSYYARQGQPELAED
ncbi:MAG: response regulator [Kiritimatiellae bacterium]|nr:response regulator [Kiritimatiellia bacterium]